MNRIFLQKDLSSFFCEAKERGAAHVTRILHPEFRMALVREVLVGSFERADEEWNGVSQRFDRFGFEGSVPMLWVLETFRRATEELVQAHGNHFPALTEWRARETVVQRYRGEDHLEAHRDLKRHPGVIVIFTIEGTGRFELLGDRRDNPPECVIEPQAGDLILLRAPGLSGAPEDRPFHRVRNPKDRISVVFRDNNRPGEFIPGFAYVK